MNKSKFVKNFRNSWEMVNPKLGVSKNDIREVVQEIGRKYGYVYIFGTPKDWEFEGPEVPVELANFGVANMSKRNFKPMIRDIADRLMMISGKSIDYSTRIDVDHYEDYQVKRFSYSVVILVLTFR